jgi:phosphatidylinositol alpha-1,6-mannosyltransferase
MNILFITFDFPPSIGGIETRVMNYIVNLHELGHKVTVIALSKSAKQCVDTFLGARVYRFPSSMLSLPSVFITLIDFIEKNTINVIHVLTGADSLIGLATTIYGRLRRIKVGIFLYGMDILKSNNQMLKRLLLLLNLHIARRVGVNSKATLRLVSAIFAYKSHILYPGVDIESLKQYEEEKSRVRGKTILFVGRLIKRKGVDDLIRAFRLLRETIPRAKLIITGDGPERNYLFNLSKKLGVQDKIQFTGTLTGKALFEKYQECEVFVMPSKSLETDVEGFGMVFLEAAFFKKPCVGTRSGGIPEAIIDGETGLLVSEGDVEGLAKALSRLLSDEKLANKYGQNAHLRVVKEFSWQMATLKLLNMYE